MKTKAIGFIIPIEFQDELLRQMCRYPLIDPDSLGRARRFVMDWKWKKAREVKGFIRGND